MRIELFILIGVTLLSIAAPALAQATGAVAGCVALEPNQPSPEPNQPIPGATIILGAQGHKITTLTDERGCYEFRDLPASVYRITARLLGADNVTRDQVNISPGQIERVDFTTRISGFCECLAPPTTLRGFYDEADAVVHVRILRPDSELPSPRGFFTQTAETLEVFKRHKIGGPIDKVFRFLQNQSSGAPDPYDVGQELVLFVGWLGTTNVFSEGPYASSRRTVTVVSADLLADLRKLMPR
jgi:hypothetical protein